MNPSAPETTHSSINTVDLVVGVVGSVTRHNSTNTVLNGEDDACSFSPLDHGSLSALRAQLAPLLGSIPLATAEGVPASMRVTGRITKRTRSGRLKVTPALEPIQVEAASGAMVAARTFEELFPAQFEHLAKEIWARAFETLSPARGPSPAIRFLKSHPGFTFRNKLLIDFSGEHSSFETFQDLWVSASMEPGPTGVFDKSRRQSTTDHHPSLGRIGAVADDFPWGNGPFHLVATLDQALKHSLRHTLSMATEEVVDRFLRGSGLTGFAYPNLVTRTRNQRDFRNDLINWIQMSSVMQTMNKSWRAVFNVDAIGAEVRRAIQAFEGSHLRALSSAFGQVSLATLDAAAATRSDFTQLRQTHGGLMTAMMDPAVVAASLATNLAPFFDGVDGDTALMASFQSGFLHELSPATAEMIRAQTPRFLGTLMTKAADHLATVSVDSEPTVSREVGYALGVKWSQLLNLCASSEAGPFLPATSLVSRKEYARLVAGMVTGEVNGKQRPSGPADAYAMARAHRLLSTSMRPIKVTGEMAGPKGGNSLRELATHILRHTSACLGQHPTGFANYVRARINQERLDESGQDQHRVPTSVVEEMASHLPSLRTETCSLRLVGVKNKQLESTWRGYLSFQVIPNQDESGGPIRDITVNGETLFLAFSVDKKWFGANSHWQTCSHIPDQHFNARQAGDLFPKMIKVEASGRHASDSIDLIANAVFGSASKTDISSQAFGARIVRHAGELSRALQELARSRPHLLSSALDIPPGDAPALDQGIEIAKACSWSALGRHLRASLKSGSVAGVYAAFQSIAIGQLRKAGEDEGRQLAWGKAFELLAKEGSANQVAAAGRAAKGCVRPSFLERAMDAAITRSDAEVLTSLIDMGGTVNADRMAAIGQWHDTLKNERLMSRVSSAYMRHAAEQARLSATSTLDDSPRPTRRRAPCL